MTTPNQSTPTPRTDESTSICGSISQREHVHADFARTLERELTEANAKYAKLVSNYSHAVLGESEQQELERVKRELAEALQQLENARTDCLDALDQRNNAHAEMIGLRQQLASKDEEIARLAPQKHEGQPETCPVCNWSNGPMLNYGDIENPKWMCHGCETRAFAQMTQQRDDYKECANRLGQLIVVAVQWIGNREALRSTITEIDEALVKLKTLKV